MFIVLISQLLSSLMAGVGVQLTLCQWMVLVAAGLTPLTWMGTPKVSKHICIRAEVSDYLCIKDFWPIAVGALITTCVACVLIIINCILTGNQLEERVYPPPTMEGCFKGEKKLKNIFKQSL